MPWILTAVDSNRQTNKVDSVKILNYYFIQVPRRRLCLIDKCDNRMLLFFELVTISICLQPCMNLVTLYSTSTGACSLHVNHICRYFVNCTTSWGKVAHVQGQECLNYMSSCGFLYLTSNELMVSMAMWVPDICTCTSKSAFYQLLARILPLHYIK